MAPFTLLCALFLTFISVSGHGRLQTYIVQLHPQTPAATAKLRWHLSLLEQAVSDHPSTRLLYSYRSAMDGFAAQLSESEVESVRRFRHVVAVRPDRVLQVQTTYSYKFLGLNPAAKEGAWVKAGFGRGSIVGVLDTGVWPESPSFNDRGMPPVPQRWRGVCQPGEGFNVSNCNRKIVGARFFSKGHRVSSSESSLPEEYLSARDSHGHGTHTASTAAGAAVPAAAVLGNGAGVATGMAPAAHVAIYKVCWFSGCYSSDILAAMDVAIRDGVDVLSLSLGGFPIPLYDDSIAIGSFRAMEHGISVVCAAGNNGPVANSVANVAPWVATVGASTLDRRFPAVVRLGNGKTLYGESMYSGNSAGKTLELVYLTDGDRGSEYCFEGSLPAEKVRRKMVVCDRGVNGRAEKGQIVKQSGGAAMILSNTEINMEEDSVDAHVLPATLLGFSESVELKRYINSTKTPTARIIFGGTVIGRARAPSVAQFSSRGPSFTDPLVPKPDFIAPGVNIIAGWPQNLGPTGLPEDTRRVNFTVMSGTSMSCPHVGGLAALLRSAHPEWSPAAVKSALMTTAAATDHHGKPIMDREKPAGIHAMGAGHVNPGRAIEPGLVYDISQNDYIVHLCSIGYTKSQIFTVTHRNVSCHGLKKANRGFSLNYPSVSVVFGAGTKTKVVKRRVTNVGEPKSVYTVKVVPPEGVRVRVRPRRLAFSHSNQSLGYRIWFVTKNQLGPMGPKFSEGQLTWTKSTDHRIKVRSPILVTRASRK